MAIESDEGADLGAIDPDHTCELCGNQLTVGEYIAGEHRDACICNPCYFSADILEDCP